MLWKRLQPSFASSALRTRLSTGSLGEAKMGEGAINIEIRSHLMIQFPANAFGEIEATSIHDLHTLLCCQQPSFKNGCYQAKLYSTKSQKENISISFTSKETLQEFVRQCNAVRTGTELWDFEPIATIGIGNWGKVILCSYQVRGENQLVAVKELSSSTPQERKYVQEERVVHAFLPDHPFVMKMLFAFQRENVSYIVMPFQQGGDLYSLLRRYSISQQSILFYASQLVLSLEHLHKHRVIHRDIKPENIFLDSLGNIKLGDFGLAKLLNYKDEKTNTFCGSEPYLSPEMLAGKSYSYSVDIWQLGCFIFELFVGHTPFYHSSQHEMRRLILECSLDYPSELPVPATQLVQQILLASPMHRLAYDWDHWQRIKEQLFFKNVNWQRVFVKSIKAPVQTVQFGRNILDNFDLEFQKESCIFKTEGRLNYNTNNLLLGFDYCCEYPTTVKKPSTKTIEDTRPPYF